MRRNSGRRLNLKPALRRRSEVQYQKSLLAIVDQINQIVTGSYDGSQASAESIAKSLVDYSGVIDDWAEMVGRKMFAQWSVKSGISGALFRKKYPLVCVT